ncbi:helix-turn-helix transcriptional regulator [Streptomyces sp. NPDC057445]|uniref:helix-turn-helix transcriptional regulator n=1 Tax=Streptomyces sp. NPDC057445 TaxID=3346136 RepID=UPI00369DB616
MPDRFFNRVRFREVRRARDLTQDDVAHAVGAAGSSVSNWEAGRSVPAPEKLPVLAALLDQSLDELFPRGDTLPDLADLRADAGLSQQETAAITRTRSAKPVANAEGGKSPLADKYLEPLALAYGVRVDDLLAAQRRSFGEEGMSPTPAAPSAAASPQGAAAAPPGLPRTIVEKIEYLLEQTDSQGLPRPDDAEIAHRGNAAVGRPVLSESLVRELRTGARSSATQEVLRALAGALDIPPLFFESDDHEVHRIVSGARLVSKGLIGIAARGDGGEVPAELLDFLAGVLDEVRGTKNAE